MVTNVGGHYIPQQNEFVCPRDGYYMFAVNMMTPNNQASHVELVIGTSRVTGQLADGRYFGVLHLHINVQCI